MVETATYGEFSTLLHERYQGRRVPMEVSIEVTHRCPLECQHCYNNLPMGDQDARKRELSLEEHVRLLDELAELGCFWILYTGGEIFARRDFLQIYTEAKKRGFLVTLFTNGTMITPRIADYLAEYRPFAIEITLYGATRETYEALTKIPGSFDRCMKGIQLLIERGLPLKLKTVPTTINYHEVYEMKRFAESLGVEFKFDPLVNPRTDCSQSPLAVRLKPEHAVALDFCDPSRRAEFARLVQREQGMSHERSAKRYTCGGGHNGCAIDPTGRMTICILSHRDGYELRSGSFAEGWNTRLREIRNTRTERDTICTNCRITSLCSMCAANGELENGDAEKPVDFLCQVAHLRAYALGVEVPEHGDCACCAGGSQHDSLRQAAERVNQDFAHLPKVVAIPKTDPLLPVLGSGESCSSGGCTSCGGNFR
ncbi:MAG TPA: radical SAM protein [Methylomirabilota bacterium]|nr:radical SAM protein [Methylomirabilota bacterium]